MNEAIKDRSHYIVYESQHLLQRIHHGEDCNIWNGKQQIKYENKLFWYCVLFSLFYDVHQSEYII